MLKKIKSFFTGSEKVDTTETVVDNVKQSEETEITETEESVELPKEIAGLTLEDWSGMEVNLGTLDNIEHKLDTYDETVGVIKAKIEDEVIMVESATSIEEGGIRDTILTVIKEEVDNTPGISQDEVEISVIEVGTTSAAIKASEALEEVLVDKYDL